MSLAGPHGEAACRYCNTLVDLGPDRKLVWHRPPGADPLRQWACRGSNTYAHTAKQENEELAFSSEPVMRHCPTCGQLVVVNTLVRRFSYHKAPQLKADTASAKDCAGSGKLVDPPKPENFDGVQWATVDWAGVDPEPLS